MPIFDSAYVELRKQAEKMTAQEWIVRLHLVPHPEGGFYKEVYRSNFEVVSPDGKSTGACTSIYYLLQDRDFSGFHTIAYPEIWYYHDGEALDVHSIDTTGKYSVTRLGKGDGEQLSLVVEPGVWFAADLPEKKSFALVSCAVAPAFDFALFEMARKEELIKKWPNHKEVLEKFCRT